MRNVTISLDEASYRRVRLLAAERDTSISGLVKALLLDVSSENGEAERLRSREQALRARIDRFRASDRLQRDALHGRGA